MGSSVDLSDKDREVSGTPSIVLLPNSVLYKEQASVIDFPQATGIFPDSVFPEIQLSSEGRGIWRGTEKKHDMMFLACTNTYTLA